MHVIYAEYTFHVFHIRRKQRAKRAGGARINLTAMRAGNNNPEVVTKEVRMTYRLRGKAGAGREGLFLQLMLAVHDGNLYDYAVMYTAFSAHRQQDYRISMLQSHQYLNYIIISA